MLIAGGGMDGASRQKVDWVTIVPKHGVRGIETGIQALLRHMLTPVLTVIAH